MRCRRQKTGGITYSDEQVADALRRWSRGESTRAIAASIGCGRRTVEWWAKRAGLERPRPINHYQHSAETRAHGVRLYVNEGWSARDVAEILGDGIDKGTVLDWVRAAGHEPRPDNPEQIDEQKAEQLYAEMRSLGRTAVALGCSKSGVRSALNRALRLRMRKELQLEQGATT